MPEKAPEFRGISRIDYKHTHGWFARVYLRGRRSKSKLFSDSLHGGREEALLKARDWITHKKAELAPDDRPQKIRYRKNPPPNNTSGRVGVSKTFSRRKGDSNDKLWCYSVTWAPTPGKPKNRAFYFNTYGSEEAAFKAACEFRAAKEREIDGQELSKEERERYLQEMTHRIMAYISTAPAHRQESMRTIHALIMAEFPDIHLEIRNNRPTYVRNGNWLDLTNRTSYITLHFSQSAPFAELLPHHPRSLMHEYCINFKDTTPLRRDDLRTLIRHALGNPSSTGTDGVPQPDQTSSDPAEKQNQETLASPNPRFWVNRVRTTKAIKTYFQEAPADRQIRLHELHGLILEAYPAVKLSMKANMPTYERKDAWIALRNQNGYVSLHVGNAEGLAEFTAKHPEIPSGADWVHFTDNVEIPQEDFQAFVLKTFTPPLHDNQVEHTVTAPEAKTGEGVDAPKRKRGRPKKTEPHAVSMPEQPKKRKRGRPKKTAQHAAPVPEPPQTRKRGRPKKTATPSVQVPDSLKAYIEAVPIERQKSLMNLHALIVSACPDVEVSMKPTGPLYEHQGRWIVIKNLRTYISVYVKEPESLTEFKTQYPKIRSGKRCLNFSDDVDIPAEAFQAMARKALTDAGHEARPPQAKKKITTLAVGEKTHSPAAAAPPASPKRKPGRPKKAEQQTVQAADRVPAPPKHKPGRPKKSQTPSATTPIRMPVLIKAYIDSMPEKRRKHMISLHNIIVTTCPEAVMSRKYDGPSYEYQGQWIAIKNFGNSISVYVKDRDSLKEFTARHPEITSGKGCLHFTDDVDIPAGAFRHVVLKAFRLADEDSGSPEETTASTVAAESQQTPATPEPPASPKRKPGRPQKTMPPQAEPFQPQQTQVPPRRKPGRPKKVRNDTAASETLSNTSNKQPQAAEASLSQTLSMLTNYMMQCPPERQQKLFMLHTLIQKICPNVQLSMNGNRPTYEYQGKWVALANQKHYLSFYVEDRTSLTEFIATHPEIKAGKSCLNFVDGETLPLSDMQTVIQKALSSDSIPHAPGPGVA